MIMMAPQNSAFGTPKTRSPKAAQCTLNHGRQDLSVKHGLRDSAHFMKQGVLQARLEGKQFLEVCNESLAFAEAVEHHEEHDEQAEQQLGNRSQDVRRDSHNRLPYLVERGVENFLEIHLAVRKAAQVVSNLLQAIGLKSAVSSGNLIDQFGHQVDGRQDHHEERQQNRESGAEAGRRVRC